jgi:hypothetical protein
MNPRRDVPQIANHAPQVVVEWSPGDSSLTAEAVVRRLWEGDPPIAVLAEGTHRLHIAVWTLQGDVHRLVADRIRRIFREAEGV